MFIHLSGESNKILILEEKQYKKQYKIKSVQIILEGISEGKKNDLNLMTIVLI